MSIPSSGRSRLAVVAAVCLATSVPGLTAASATVSPAVPTSSHAAAGHSGAGGQPAPAGFASWQALYAEQAHLDRAASQVLDFGRKSGGSYTSVVADPSKRRVQVYVKDGKPDPALARLIKQLQDTAPIQVESAPYSKNQLDHAVQQVVALALHKKVPGITSFAPDPGGQGINVTTSAPIATAARELGGLPVALHFRTGSADVSAPPAAKPPTTKDLKFGRWGNEIELAGAPWWTGFGLCTLGTPFVSPASGQTGWLTAKHCTNDGKAGDVVTGSVFGTVADVPAATGADGVYRNGDLSAILSPYAQPGVWSNTADPVASTHPVTSQRTSSVTGRADNIVGNMVETNGGFTGETGHGRSVEILGTGIYTTAADGEVQGPFVYAEDVSSGAAIAGPGDSGGMVMMPDPRFLYSTAFLSLGTIHAMPTSKPAACIGFEPNRGGKPCGAGVLYNDLYDAELQANVLVLAGE